MGLPRETLGNGQVESIARSTPSLMSGLVESKVDPVPVLQQGLAARMESLSTIGTTRPVSAQHTEVRSAPPPPPRLISAVEPVRASSIASGPIAASSVRAYDDSCSQTGWNSLPHLGGGTEVLRGFPASSGGATPGAAEQTIALAAEAIASRLQGPLDGRNDRLQADLRAAGDACMRAQAAAQQGFSRPITPRAEMVSSQFTTAAYAPCEMPPGPPTVMPLLELERSYHPYQSCANYGILPAAPCAVPWPPPPLPPVSTELAARVEALEHTSSRPARSSIDVDRQLERLQIELREAEANTARALKEQLVSANSGWQERLDGLQASYDGQLASLEELRQSHALLVDERDRLRADIQQMQASRSDDEARYKDVKQRLQELEAERQNLQQEIQDLQAGHEETHRSWKQKHDMASAERDELHVTIVELKEQANTHMSASHDWRRKHQASDDEWRRKHQGAEDDWRRKHQATEDEWRQRHISVEDEYRRTHQAMLSDKDRLKMDLDQLQAAHVSEQQTRKEVLQKHKAVENELMRVHGDLQHLQATCDEHVQGKEALARQQREIEAELSRLQTDFVALKGDLAREQAAREEAERKHKVVLQDLEVLRADMLQKEEFRDRIMRESYSLKESLLREQTKIEDLRADKEAEIRELQSISAEEQAKSREAEVHVNKTTQEIEDLQAQLQQEMEDRERLRKMLEQKREANNDFRLALDNQREETRVILEEIDKAKEARQMSMRRASVRENVRQSMMLAQKIEDVAETVSIRASSLHGGGGQVISVNLLDERDSPSLGSGQLAQEVITREYNSGSFRSGAPAEDDGPLRRMSSRSTTSLLGPQPMTTEVDLTADVSDDEMWDPRSPTK
mmetsp:Transcript_34850/g.81415  ORF Transcript_34850/g.81415 Transcript_34850/m.81415 type:complete len:857 (+) Transcript_34850:56-2626(+)